MISCSRRFSSALFYARAYNAHAREGKRWFFMFGLGDAAIAAAIILCIASAVLCVIYGAMNWNKSDDAEGGRK